MTTPETNNPKREPAANSERKNFKFKLVADQKLVDSSEAETNTDTDERSDTVHLLGENMCALILDEQEIEVSGTPNIAYKLSGTGQQRTIDLSLTLSLKPHLRNPPTAGLDEDKAYAIFLATPQSADPMTAGSEASIEIGYNNNRFSITFTDFILPIMYKGESGN